MDLIQACIEEDDAVREYQNKDKILKSHDEKTIQFVSSILENRPKTLSEHWKGFYSGDTKIDFNYVKDYLIQDLQVKKWFAITKKNKTRTSIIPCSLCSSSCLIVLNVV